jgi:hypothetical protein
MSKSNRIDRGDIMRRIAAMYAKLDSLSKSGQTGDRRLAERQKIKGQIADLKEQMLA